MSVGDGREARDQLEVEVRENNSRLQLVDKGSRWNRFRDQRSVDGMREGKLQDESSSAFTKILVDAPCSGERHLLASPRELERWSVKGSKRLAVRQNALLCSALDCLAPGGRLVYSTCSISPLENDGVIERLQSSREGMFRVVAVGEWLEAAKANEFTREIAGDSGTPASIENSVDDLLKIGEPTSLGWIVLPDVAGCGPIYTAVLEKNL